jgi:sulfite exporter TauE/SafE
MVSEGFILGFSSGAYCLVSCLPVLLPFFASEPVSGWRQNIRYLSLVMLGRLFGYLIAGIVISWAGSFALGYVDPALKRKLLAGANIGAGLLMIISGLILHRPQNHLCRKLKPFWRPSWQSLAFGFFTGINICPPFIAAASRVFGRGDPLLGATYFFLFFLGTSIYLIPLLAVQPLQKRIREIRLIGRMTMILLGIYFFLVQGVFLTSRGAFK